MTDENAPSEIRRGRRALEGMPGVEIMGPLVFDPVECRWSLPISLTILHESAHVPRTTAWYVLVASDYPNGRVILRPARSGGLTSTFRHMRHNLEGEGLWRTGDPCLDRPGRWLGSRDLAIQPKSADERIHWHVERALEWLASAACDQLTDVGEPFELPPFDTGDLTFGFDEDSKTMSAWSPLLGRAGNALVKRLGARLFVTFSMSEHGNSINEPRWGRRLSTNDDAEPAAWLALRDIPVFAPWNTPQTWGEMREVCKVQNVDLDGHLKWIYHHLRADGIFRSSWLMLGFPIPDVFDGPAVRMHWQPVRLPSAIDLRLQRFTVEKARASDVTWKLERKRFFNDGECIEWHAAEPWSEERLRVRGSLGVGLRHAHVILIGAGALGSILADLLVRAGVNDLIVCDGEVMEVGNLRRHVLTIDAVPFGKAPSLAEYLNSTSVFADVRWARRFPDGLSNMRDAVGSADIVIDCTANDDVASRIESFSWDDGARWFFSGSLGVDARRLFFYAAREHTFPAGAFLAAVRPYADEERTLLKERDPFSMQGAGCWNPVFPGRWDDIVLLAARMVRMIDATVAGDLGACALKVVDRAA